MVTIKEILENSKDTGCFDKMNIIQNSHCIPVELYWLHSEMPLGTVCRHVVNFYSPDLGKLQTVKCLKAITGIGLKEAKDLVDSMW